MSLKTRLRISIVTLVTLLVFAQCVISLRIAAEDKFRDALERSQSILEQARHLVLVRVNEQAAAARPAPRTVAESKALWQSTVEKDEALSSLLIKVIASSNAVVEVLVCDDAGRILASSSPLENRRQDYLGLPDFVQWGTRPVWERLFEIFTETHDYALVESLGVPGQSILTIRVVVSSVLLGASIKPQVTSLAMVSSLSLLASILVAYLFSNVVLRSLDRLSRRIESITAGKPDAAKGPPGKEAKEFADMQSKLDLLSQQFRGAREDVSQLRSNIERMLERLEEGVLLFDPHGRLMRMSASCERMLGLTRDEIAGLRLAEIFPEASPLGSLLRQAIETQRAVRDAAVTVERRQAPPVRLLANF